MPSTFRPPRQQRSAATLDRIVKAAEDLFAERGFEAATVDDIVARAGSSKGSFYSRFADKQALLAYLGGECLARAKATWAELLDPERTAGQPLDKVLEELQQHRDAASENNLRAALVQLCNAVTRFLKNSTQAHAHEVLVAVETVKRLLGDTDRGRRFSRLRFWEA